MWTYVQRTGFLRDAQGQLIGRAYSGAAPLGRDNPALQEVHNVGPIPVGEYTIGPPHDTQTHGPYVLDLTPDEDNEMFGRSGFLIHDDRRVGPPGYASQGCIIAARHIREAIGQSDDNRLRVIADDEGT